MAREERATRERAALRATMAKLRAEQGELNEARERAALAALMAEQHRALAELTLGRRAGDARDAGARGSALLEHSSAGAGGNRLNDEARASVDRVVVELGGGGLDDAAAIALVAMARRADAEEEASREEEEEASRGLRNGQRRSVIGDVGCWKRASDNNSNSLSLPTTRRSRSGSLARWWDRYS